MLRNGDVIGGRTIIERLGSGGYGTVFRAHNPRTHRDEAVKVIVDEGTNRARFERERRLLGELGDHPHIATVFDADEDEGRLWIAMQLIEGRSLRDRIRANDLTPEELRALVRQIGSALAVAHAHPKVVLHRDVSPTNIMHEDSTGTWFLIDFGISAELDPHPDLTAVSGTMRPANERYAPPEQITPKGEMSERSDVYAFASTLFCAVTGQAPYDAYDAKGIALFETIRDPGSKPATVVSIAGERGRPLDEALDPALRFRAGTRCSLAELVSATDAALGSYTIPFPFGPELEPEPEPAAELDAAPQASKWTAGRVAAMLAAAAVLILAVVGLTEFTPLFSGDSSAETESGRDRGNEDEQAREGELFAAEQDRLQGVHRRQIVTARNRSRATVSEHQKRLREFVEGRIGDPRSDHCERWRRDMPAKSIARVRCNYQDAAVYFTQFASLKQADAWFERRWKSLKPARSSVRSTVASDVTCSPDMEYWWEDSPNNRLGELRMRRDGRRNVILWTYTGARARAVVATTSTSRPGLHRLCDSWIAA